MICVECNRTIVGSERCPLCDAETVMPKQTRPEPRGLRGRPGTALAKIIPKWAASQKSGCGCKDYQKKMDLWGTVGCEVQFDNIVSHLLKQEKHLISPLRILPDRIKKKFAEALVSRAIERSRQD